MRNGKRGDTEEPSVSDFSHWRAQGPRWDGSWNSAPSTPVGGHEFIYLALFCVAELLLAPGVPWEEGGSQEEKVVPSSSQHSQPSSPARWRDGSCRRRLQREEAKAGEKRFKGAVRVDPVSQ